MGIELMAQNSFALEASDFRSSRVVSSRVFGALRFSEAGTRDRVGGPEPQARFLQEVGFDLAFVGFAQLLWRVRGTEAQAESLTRV